MAICKLVLSVIKIPNIHPSVFSSQEEDTWSSRGETTISQISPVISSSNNRGFKFFKPDLSTPISYREEISLIWYTSVQGVDWSEMSSDFKSVSIGDFYVLFGLFVSSKDDTLFSSYQEFIGTSLSIEFDNRSSDYSVSSFNLFGQ